MSFLFIEKEMLEEVTNGTLDPAEYCGHIQSEVKKAKMRVATKHLSQNMSKAQMEEEREVQSKQLQEIFKLMQTQNDQFGVDSVDDVSEQMKLYVQ